MSDELLKRISRLLREGSGPGAEHERLRSELTAWANGTGFTKSYSAFQSGDKPDVLRGTPDNKYLFVGDAKDANNETAANADTISRIASYFREFAKHLGDLGYSGGRLAIATNSIAAARGWVLPLNTLAQSSGITGGAHQEPPNFQITETSAGRTWIIHW